jgi:hypothetical protein
MYKYYNPHPKGLSTDDCVKRAIVVVTGMEYKAVTSALNSFRMVSGAKRYNTDRNPHRYVSDVLGAKKLAVSDNMTVKQFCSSHPQGRYILDLPGHWVGVYDSDYYDEWDCGDEIVNCAYEITSEPFFPPSHQNMVFKNCCTSQTVSETEALISIYDGNGSSVKRRIPSELTEGYVLCLMHSHYSYIDLDGMNKKR